MDFQKFVEWAFLALLSGCIVVAVSELRGFRVSVDSEMRSLRESIEKLNATIAQLIEKTMNHEKQLDKHEERIHDLENTRRT